MSAGEMWLRESVSGAPPALLATMIEALPAGSASAADELAEGAIALYEQVVHGTGEREDALPLLAADALLTHAFQAQAETDPSGVARLAERLGARGRLREVAS